MNALVMSQGGTAQSGDHKQAPRRVADAEAQLRRFQSAIEAGIDPAALVEVINQAQFERETARAQLDNTPAPNNLTEAEVYAMVDSPGDVGAALAGSDTDKLTQLYADLGLELVYDNEKETVDATVSPRVNNLRVRGRSRTLATRLQLPG